MCSHDDSPGVPLSFARLAAFLREPPFEPCESELQYLSPAEYDEYFTEVMRIYRRPIIYLIARLTDDYDGAPDLAQEVFANLYRARISFEKSYIYRSARNAAYTELRRRSRQRRAMYAFQMGITLCDKGKKSEDADRKDPQPLQDERLIERAREEAVRRAVERLPEHFRAPLALFAEGKTYRQIMKITQTNVGTVKSRICRGKALLRRRLRDYL